MGGIIPSGRMDVKMVVRCLVLSVYTATVAQVRELVDGLDAETALAWANETAPDEVPSFEAWVYPEDSG